MKPIVLALVLLFLAAPAAADDAAPRADGIQPALIESAKDLDPAVRQTAAARLGETKNKSAVSVLSGMALNDPDESVRLAALGALVSIGDPSAMPAYIKALGDEGEKVRRSAAGALSGLWDEAGQRALMGSLKNDPSPKVRQKAAEALGNPGVMGRYKAHNWDSSVDTEASLIQALKNDESYEVRATAALMLGRFKSGKAVEPLMKALEDKYTSVRAAAAESLGAYDRPEVLDKLIEIIQFEGEEDVLVGALRSVKYLDDRRLAEPVVQSLRSGSQKVRWQAIDVIETLRPPEAVEPLRRVAEDKYESDGVREKAKEALQVLGAE